MKRKYEFLNDVKMDFSEYEEVPFTEMERQTMKHNFKKSNKTYHSRKRVMWAAACVACLAVTSQTAFARDLAEKIFSLGHSSIIAGTESTSDEVLTEPIPEELQGKLFDKDGKELTELRSDIQEVYDKNGDQVIICSKSQDGKTTYSIEKYSDEDPLSTDDSVILVDSIDELEKNLSFDLKVPEELPDGFSLTKIYGVKDEDGSLSPDYAFLDYSDEENSFIIYEQPDKEETKFSTGLNDPKEMDFHGNTAIYNDSEFYASWDGTIISIMGNDTLTGEALLKVAESLS